MKTQIELNQALLDAVVACNYEETERLLKLGADPLGPIDEKEPEDTVLGELFSELSDFDDDEEDEEDVGLVKNFQNYLHLFYAYGMDIAASRALPRGEDYARPLWDLAHVRTEVGLNVLHTLLEHGLDYASAEDLVEHITIDMELFDGCKIEDDWWLKRSVCQLKMIMLVASYPDILNQSSYIQDCVAFEKNDKQKAILFRNWNDFDYQIDLSTCTNLPDGLRGATVRIQDKRTGKQIWERDI